MENNKELNWICVLCGKKYGSPKTFISTWHHGHCDYCDSDVNVTSSRDYGYPKKEKKNES